MLRQHCFVWLAVSVLSTGLSSARAQECSTPAQGCAEALCSEGRPADSCWTRPTLTGDWLGLRSALQESGVTFRGDSTHYGYGIDGGITRPVPAPLGRGDTFTYTGRNEYEWIFDLEKFGGLPKGKLSVIAEHWYGDFGGVGLRGATIIPSVFPAMLPPNFRDEGVPILSNFMFSQPLSEKLVVFAGKSDVLGKMDQDIFAGGDGTHQFVNQAFIANPAFLLALPYTSFATGFVAPRKWGNISGAVRDPQHRHNDFFKFDDLFSDGVIVIGQVKVNTNFWGKPGQHHVGGTWAHTALPDLASSASFPGFPYPGTTLGLGTKKDSYTIFYGFDQYLVSYSGQPKQRGWGLFGRASISDGNPTPFQYFLSLGIGGDSRLRCDAGDTFGIGWYYSGTSKEFGPVGQALLQPRDGTGVELFYNFQVTPSMNITPGMQFIRQGIPALGTDTAFIYGVRINFKL